MAFIPDHFHIMEDNPAMPPYLLCPANLFNAYSSSQSFLRLAGSPLGGCNLLFLLDIVSSLGHPEVIGVETC
jgi:hypothetical protein